jgi:plastocyanin
VGRGGASSAPGGAGASSGSSSAASAPPPAISPAEGGLAPGLESPSGPPPSPARAQITAREFSLTLSRPEVPSGKLILEFVDGGQDEHNLHIRPSAGGPDVGAFPNTLPGQHLDITFSLAPGTYTLYCSIPAHEELGMKASFTVR